MHRAVLRHHPCLRWQHVVVACAVVAVLLGGGLWAVPVRGTPYYYDTEFRRQWQQHEAVIPGFWGPLTTSTARNEPYAGRLTGVLCALDPPTAPAGVAYACLAVGLGNQRTVQYFDKGRMEVYTLGYTEGGPRHVLTNGLLAVELRDGRIQTGDASFDQRSPAALPLAGDPGNPGPTYADLAALPERDPDAATTPPPFTFDVGTRQWERAQIPPASIPASVLAYSRMTDPTGRYDQNVLAAFADTINRLPNGEAAVGLPISPVFVLRVPVNGTPTDLVAQAFERRVLTYNPTNVPTQRVESTNIGRDYYDWRYGANNPERYGPPPIVYPTRNPAAIQPTATATAGAAPSPPPPPTPCPLP